MTENKQSPPKPQPSRPCELSIDDLTHAQIEAIERDTGVKRAGWDLLNKKHLRSAISRATGRESAVQAQLQALLEHYCQLARQDGINPEREPIIIETRKLLKES